jgi:alpha-tubulin suppressor-like RCC1 family protein
VWAWGFDKYGQLGNGMFATGGCRCIDKPVQVLNLTNVTGIAAGGYHSLALKRDGTLWAWGFNDFGQLGNGGFLNSARPVQILSLTNVRVIAGGTYHSLALATGGMRAPLLVVVPRSPAPRYRPPS